MNSTTTTKKAQPIPENRATSPTITLSKGGTKERTLKLSELVIPDLWRTESPDKILETWHIAHDLKRELWDVHADRSELLEACKAVVSNLREHNAGQLDDAIDCLRCAIAGATGKPVS